MKIRELSISARAKVCLLTAGYEALEDLKDITDEELLEIRNLNAKGVAEIREKIEEYFAEENMNMYDEAMKIAIDELEFSERTYNCLKRAGINTLGDLCDRMWDDMIHVQNLGKKGFEEILFKISALGYSFKDEQRNDIYDYPMFKELLSMPIADMNISQSTKDILSQNGIDIIKELKEFGVNVLISDPLANSEEVLQQYNLTLTDINEISNLDALIIAVSHDFYKLFSLDSLNKFFNTSITPVLIDVKGLFEKDKAKNLNYLYWRL